MRQRLAVLAYVLVCILFVTGLLDAATPRAPAAGR
jgi:hypothetical protein